MDESRVKLGGNAVLAMRFDCNQIGGIMTEVVAYGTAVTVEAAGEMEEWRMAQQASTGLHE